MPKIRVVVANMNKVVSGRIASILDIDRSFELVGREGQNLLGEILKLQPDLLVYKVSDIEEGDLEVLRKIKNSSSWTKVVIFSTVPVKTEGLKENNGNVPLSNVSIRDNTLNEAVVLAKTELAPGESTNGTLEYVVVESDLPGSVVNTATATGYYNNVAVTADDDASVTLLIPNQELVGFTPGYWKNWRKHYSTEQFNSLLAGTIAVDSDSADKIFSKYSAGPGMELTILRAHLLATQLTLNLTRMPVLPNTGNAYLVESGNVELGEIQTVGEAVQKALDVLDNPDCYTREQVLDIKDLLDHINNLG